MKYKELEVGDSVRVKYTTKIHGNDAMVYLDGKLIHRCDDEFNADDGSLWLVEYSLDCVRGAPTYQSCWWENDITSKHYVGPTEDELLAKAEKIDIKDYKGRFFYNDRYFDSVEEISDAYEGFKPDLAWTCDTTPVELQLALEDLVRERLDEEGHEGLSEESHFQPLYEELNSIQDQIVALAAKEMVSYPNYKKAVIL